MRLVVYYDKILKRYGMCSEERTKIHRYEEEIPILITTSERIARAVMYKMNEGGIKNDVY